MLISPGIVPPGASEWFGPQICAATEILGNEHAFAVRRQHKRHFARPVAEALENSVYGRPVPGARSLIINTSKGIGTTEGDNRCQELSVPVGMDLNRWELGPERPAA